MRLVIPYKHTPDNGMELRYAIRSMVKHFKSLTGVLLIGDKPDWYIGEYIQASDEVGRKEWSIVSKVLLCPDEDFLFSMDDVFALQDFDSTLPLYYSGTLKDHKCWDKYIDRKNNVMKVYPDGLFYDIHTPHIINRTKYHECQPKDWDKKEYLCKSLYGNYVVGGEQLEDYKIRKLKDLNIDMSRLFFSSSNYIASRINFVELFPVKSEYEK